MIKITRKVRKFHNTGWENSYFASSDISFLGHGCGVSQYTQLYYQQS